MPWITFTTLATLLFFVDCFDGFDCCSVLVAIVAVVVVAVVVLVFVVVFVVAALTVFLFWVGLFDDCGFNTGDPNKCGAAGFSGLVLVVVVLDVVLVVVLDVVVLDIVLVVVLDVVLAWNAGTGGFFVLLWGLATNALNRCVLLDVLLPTLDRCCCRCCCCCGCCCGGIAPLLGRTTPLTNCCTSSS